VKVRLVIRSVALVVLALAQFCSALASSIIVSLARC
jgi:hypothetical protein